jgi:hypothetical protein
MPRRYTNDRIAGVQITVLLVLCVIVVIVIFWLQGN